MLAEGIVLRGSENIVELLKPYLPENGASQRRVQAMLGEVLATEGYFSPVFEFSNEDGTTALYVAPGPRTTVSNVDMRIDGPIEEPRRSMLRNGWPLPIGSAFRQAAWNDAKLQILSDLLAVEHAGARLVDSLAEIDTETQRADVRVHYDAGPRYRFGELQVEGLQRYPEDLVSRYNRGFREGDSYREDLLRAFQSTLLTTPYFASAEVALDLAQSEDDGEGFATAPVRVSVRERPAHRFGVGVGVSSNTGARVEANYHTPNLLNKAWVLDGGLRIEQKKQTLYSDVFLPPDETGRRHGVGLMVEATDIEGLKTDRYAFGAQTVLQRGNLEQRLSLNWERERREPDGAMATTNSALVPNVMWTWRQVDNPLDPRDGVVWQAQMGGGSKALASDQDFLRLQGRWQQYFPIGRLDTVALRAELGVTLADLRKNIPQDYLFRTGGTGSVRGYSYQSLGVTEGSATVGGRYMGVLSAEATHWFNETWGVAAFVDAGEAADNVEDLNLAVGYGLGARWKSPAGPIGLDLAYGQRTSSWQIHFALAIPF
ncbi:autotransporter assembly complex protein TamA [Propionivibrio limicola]|uniref:autotransporter assembly complex protein TamA n=1 Tax=Propionivibrio limicola TaxID=167645 RepID=UPI001FE9B35F|nr:autotransporter assembly complex family protein [Propionivibrio limicola]